MRSTDVSAKSDMRLQAALVRPKAAESFSGATKVGVVHAAVLCTEPCVLTEGKVVSDLVVHEVETSAPITRVVVSFGEDSSPIAAGAGRKCSVAAEQQKCVEHVTWVPCSTLNFPAHAGMLVNRLIHCDLNGGAWEKVGNGMTPVVPPLNVARNLSARGRSQKMGGVIIDLLVEIALRVGGFRCQAGLARLKGTRLWAHSQISY